MENNDKKLHIKLLWKKASKIYYEKNKEIIRAKNLAKYHKKKNNANSDSTADTVSRDK